MMSIKNNKNMKSTKTPKNQRKEQARIPKKKEQLPDIRMEDVDDLAIGNLHLLRKHPLIRQTTQNKIIDGYMINVTNFSLATRNAKKYNIRLLVMMVFTKRLDTCAS